MKPRNFPERKRLRQVRAQARRENIELLPRGFDHGASSTAAEIAFITGPDKA